MRKKLSLLFSILLFLVFSVALLAGDQVYASAPLDEILKYEITVDVNDDASLNIRYDISWKVLDSDSEGPLEWAMIGLPNKSTKDYTALSDNIDYISISSSGGYYANVYFKEKYYKDDVVNFSFEIQQDRMYQMNTDTGFTLYSFTPGWFDSAAVDELIIHWNIDKVQSFSPDSMIENGYMTWYDSLKPNERYTVEAVYENDAFAFEMVEDEEEEFSVAYAIGIFIGIILIIIVFAAPIAIPILIAYGVYKASSGFKAETTTKTTKTLVEYYPSCPNCGGSRGENSEKCQYCDTNMVKSKQVIDEEKLSAPEKKTYSSYNTVGEHTFAGRPNTYVVVHQTRVPVTRSTSSHSASSAHSGSTGKSSGSSHRSSCACAHSSCACACACACAGGGRAGCTTKDFYNTNLKLKHIVLKKRGK